MNKTTKVMLAADTHGEWDRLATEAVGEKADFILHAGDLGFYPDETCMDVKALRHYLLSPDVVGQAFPYFKGEKVFPIPLFFVRGNHEAFSLLNEIKLTNIYYLDSGVYNIHGVYVAALGGIYYAGGKKGKIGLPKYTQREEVDTLLGAGRGVQIFLSHDSPPDAVPGFPSEHGSKWVKEILAMLRPTYMVHGHYHGSTTEYQYLRTQVTGLGIKEYKCLDLTIDADEESVFERLI